jgi:pimeloyl-ACP methyl ester carboxylesterase
MGSNGSTPRGVKGTPAGATLTVLGVAAGAAAVAAALPAAVAWAFLHPPRRLHHRTPKSALGLPYERLRLSAADGVRLSAWLVRVHDRPARGVVVVCHGYYGNRATMLPYLRLLHRAGYHCLLFDFRAHGWSGGRRTTFGIGEARDLRAALAYVFASHEFAGLPVAVLGESMGASVALLVAADEPRVGAVVADSAFARFDSAVEGRLALAFGEKLAPAITPGARRVGERLLGRATDEIAPVDGIARIAPRPVLLIHGEDDRLIVPENVHRLYAAAEAGGCATLWTVPGAGHVMSVYVGGDEYARRVTAFLDAALPPPTEAE